MPSRTEFDPGGQKAGLTRQSRQGLVATLASMVVAGVLYYLLVKLSTFLYSPDSVIAPLLPHIGFAIAVFVIRGMWLWPGILAGSLVGNYYVGLNENGLLIAGMISVFMLLQALAAAWLLGRYVERPRLLIEERDVLQALLMAGPLAAVIGPTGSVLTLVFQGSLEASAAPVLLLTWWAVTSISIILFTPLFLLLWPGAWPHPLMAKVRYIGWLLLTALLLIAGSVALDRFQVNRDYEMALSRVESFARQNLPRVNHPLTPFGTLVRFFAASEQVSERTFVEFVRPMVQRPEIAALSYLAPDAGDDATTAGAGDLSVRYRLADTGVESRVANGNLGELRHNLQAAIESGGEAVSTLVQSSDDGRPLLVVFKPVFAAEQPDRFKGIVAMTMECVGLFAPLERILRDLPLQLQVLDVTPGGGSSEVIGDLGETATLAWQEEFDVVDRRWRLQVGLSLENWWWFREGLTSLLFLWLGASLAFLSAYAVLATRAREWFQLVNEQRWREREARLSAIIESPPEVIVAVDSELRLTNYNRAFTQICQSTLGKLPRPGMNILEIFGADAKARADTQKRFNLALAGEHVHHQASLWGASGQEMLTDSTYSPIVDVDGDIIGVSVIIRDVTEPRRMEEALKRQLDELRRWRQVTLDRESRIMELKREVNVALAANGQPPRYRVTGEGREEE